MGNCIPRWMRKKLPAPALVMEEMADPVMRILQLEAYIQNQHKARENERERHARSMAAPGASSVGARATKLLRDRSIENYDMRIAVAENLRLHLEMAMETRENTGVVSAAMRDLRAVTKDISSVDALAKQKDEFDDALRHLSDVTREIHELMSPSHSLVGIGGPDVSDAILESEIEVYEDMATTPSAPAPVPDDRVVPQRRPPVQTKAKIRAKEAAARV